MNIIAQNPYRVLGMFANDSLKVMTANIARIRAYLKVGKSCEFESDYVEVFGSVDRSEEEVEKAIKELSEPTNSNIYKLFWLHRTDTLPKSPCSATDIFIDGNGGIDREDVVNCFVCAIRLGEKYEISECLLNLINTFKGTSDFQPGRLIRSLVQESDTITLNELWDNCKTICNSPLFTGLDVISKEVNSIAIDWLNKDCEASTLQKDYPRWKNLFNIHKYALPVIELIKETCDIETLEPNAESQIVLSDYAKVMEAACERCYSQLRFRIVAESEEFLKVLRDLYRLSYNSTVKEQCAEFGKKVKSQQKFLAPDSVLSHSDAIQNEIDNFCEKQDEVKWSLALLRNCAKILLDIKAKLGESHPYYRRISTQVADNALYSANIELSAALRKFNNPDNDKDVALNYLKHIIKNCAILISDIYQLNIEEEFKSTKAAPFLIKIADLKDKYHISDEETKPDISLTTDAEKIAECGEDYHALKSFVINNPNSPHIKEAMAKIWGIEDAEFSNNGSAKDLLNYKQKFPHSHNEQKILAKLDHLLLGTTLGSVFDYRLMLRLWPDHPKKAIIEGRIDLINFKNCCCVGDWVAYLKEFPNGQHRIEARKCIESEKYKECKTLSDLNKFILAYPTSEYFNAACARIEEFVYESAIRTADYNHYLRQYPNGKHSSEIRAKLEYEEFQAFISSGDYSGYYRKYPNGKYTKEVRKAEEQAIFSKCKTPKDYKEYLKKYPNGIHKSIAYKQLAKHRNKILFWCILGLCAIVLIIYFYRQTSSGNPDYHQSVNDYTAQAAYSENHPINTGTQSESNMAENVIPEDNYESPYRYNSLSTGARPYKDYFGRSLSGGHQMRFNTDSGNDYVVIVKRHSNGKYVDHIYIKGGDYASMKIPDGTFDVYFYSGTGWNPYKMNGECEGGFIENEALQKDGPITLQRRYEGDYYYDQTLSYTLYPVYNGNLALQKASEEEAF